MAVYYKIAWFAAEEKLTTWKQAWTITYWLAKSQMKVNLAVQTLIASVADAIDFCCSKLNMVDFNGASPNTKFPTNVWPNFEIHLLNSRYPFGKLLCQPEICYSQFIDDSLSYITGLKDLQLEAIN